jgi:quinol monooxygenase YgiN
MDLEVAMLQAKDGDSAGLIKVMNEGGCAALESCPGCRSAKVYPGVENPGTVLFLVEWDSVDAHNAAKGTPGFARFVELASPFFGEGGSMQHFKVG